MNCWVDMGFDVNNCEQGGFSGCSRESLCEYSETEADANDGESLESDFLV